MPARETAKPWHARILGRVEVTARACRRRFDRAARRFGASLFVGTLAVGAAFASWLVAHFAWRRCPSRAFSFLDFELTFSPRAFSSLLARAGRCESDVVTSLVTTDVLFPIAYAVFLSALYVWADGYRRFAPGIVQIDKDGKANYKPPTPLENRRLPLLSSIAMLLPFVCAWVDIVAENVPLYIAARFGDGSAAFRPLVMIGSYGAALKWTLLVLFVLGLASAVFGGPRGHVLWRVRYSVLAVFLGALPLLLIPQGQDVLQRLVEGAHPVWRIAWSALTLASTALVIWYCGRTLVRVRITDTNAPEEGQAGLPADPWLPFFERHIPRMVGVGVLVLAGMAFAKAGLAAVQYTVVAIASYAFGLVLARYKAAFVTGTGRIDFRREHARKHMLMREHISRACLAIVMSVLIVWPANPRSWQWLYRGEDAGDLFHLRVGAALILDIAWVLYLFVYFRHDWAELRKAPSIEAFAGTRTESKAALAAPFPDGKPPVHVKWLAAAGLLVNIAFLAVFTRAPVPAARALGPFVVIAIAAANAVFIASLLEYTGRRLRMPVVTMLLVLAAVFSRWNNNHAIRTLPAATGDSLKNRLSAWLADRSAEDSGSPPLVLVAASGGGLRAAYWTAVTLATLQDGDTAFAGHAFARHVFAISGVSGGSFGAALFSAMMRDVTQRRVGPECRPRLARAQGESWRDVDSVVLSQPPPVAPCVRLMLSDDFLSPVLAMFAGPDLLQAFLPFPVPGFDRSLALEQSWEQSYRSTMGDSTFEMGFRHLFAGPGAVRGIPALLINTTHVQTGRRYVASPFVDNAIFLDAPGVHEALGADFRLSTAAHNSARFPYVSPAGRIDRGDGAEYGALVDGGYFENSGLATLNDLRRALRRTLDTLKGRANIVVLYLCNDPRPCDRERHELTSLETGRGALGEWLAPFRALLAVRDARGAMARAQIVADHEAKLFQLNVCGSIRVAPNATASDSAALTLASERVVAPPLGWLLSGRVRRLMDSSLVLGLGDEQLKTVDHCRADNVRQMRELLGVLRAARNVK